MDTPRYNPPASSAAVVSSAPVLKPEEVKSAEAFTRRMIQFQRSEGCFVLTTNEAVTHLGSEVFDIVNELVADGLMFNLAVTITLIALFEKRLQQCEDLWRLVIEKARQYVRSCPGEYYGVGGKVSKIEKAGGRVTTVRNLPLDNVDES